MKNPLRHITLFAAPLQLCRLDWSNARPIDSLRPVSGEVSSPVATLHRSIVKATSSKSYDVHLACSQPLDLQVGGCFGQQWRVSDCLRDCYCDCDGSMQCRRVNGYCWEAYFCIDSGGCACVESTSQSVATDGGQNITFVERATGRTTKCQGGN